LRVLRLRLGVAVLAMGFCAAAVAQDVPGIEICTAEKTMERRTSCLQSNVNFLQQSLTKQALSFQQKLDANTREMDGLKVLIAAMRKEIDELKAAAAKEKEPAKK
jgi:peptidoglycan hydrolase CwlO-like protein